MKVTAADALAQAVRDQRKVNKLTQTATAEQVNHLTVRKQNAGKLTPGLSQRRFSRR